MSSPIQLIVGLANPGKEYANTRHNAGAWFIDDLADQFGVNLRMDAKFHGLHGIAKIDGQSVHLLVPTTFMNLSGQSVRACANYNKISPDSILIAHDEVDLPVGAIKLKFDGGDGGHNGLKDIIRHLSTKQFYRLRIGIGRPRSGKDTADYVLESPSRSEREQIDLCLDQAQEILPLMLAGELSKAMQQLHTDTTK